jgi:hypothetical protein
MDEATYGRAIAPAPGEHEVHTRGGRYVVCLYDRSIIDYDAVCAYVRSAHLTNTNNNNAQEAPTMNDHTNTDTPSMRDIENADAAAGWLERWNPESGRASVVRWIGQNARTIKERQAVNRVWSDLLWSGTLGYVTLDTDPETPGRPQSMRPGVPALVVIEYPEHHPDAGTVAVIYVQPRQTFPTKPDPVTGERAELADYKDGSAAAALVGYLSATSADEVDEWIKEGRQAVAAVARASAGMPEDDAAAVAEKVAAEYARLSRL